MKKSTRMLRFFLKRSILSLYSIMKTIIAILLIAALVIVSLVLKNYLKKRLGL